MRLARHQTRIIGVSTERARLRGAIAWFWVVFWLMFLVEPIGGNIAAGGRRTLGALVLVAGAGIYTPVVIVTMRRLWAGRPRTRTGEGVAAVAGLAITACMLEAAALIGQTGFALLPYAMVLFTMGMSRFLGGGLAFCVVASTYSLSSNLTGRTMDSGLLVAAVASGVAAGLGAFSAERTRDADAAREDAALLRVQDERNRMARDLHDILGHSLTVITMKAELAGKLIDVDPAKAKEQIADLEKLSRGALADVRQTVSGYREMSLAGELARSRRALTDAGIRVEMPGNVEEVDPDLRELFAWTVREATTNIIRHSGASSCTVDLEPTRIAIIDDGRGASTHATESGGHGLAGLQERAAAHGAHVTRSSEHGFTLVVEALPPDTNPLGTDAPPKSSRLHRASWASRTPAPVGDTQTPLSPEEN